MPLSTILAIAAILAFASTVNGFLGGGLCLFTWAVLLGMVRQAVPIPGGVAKITEYTWAPHLMLPLVVFLIFWQWKLRGKIGPQVGLRDLIRRRSTA